MALNDFAREIRGLYSQIRPEIEKRIGEFEKFFDSSDERAVFKELCFCLFTPQSKAVACWEAVETLDREGLLLRAGHMAIAERIKQVRFRFNKAKYLVEARGKFMRRGRLVIKSFLDGHSSRIRDSLVKEIKGLGMKEASHFLRNIGKGMDLAILDRHILKNLHKCSVIAHVPKSLARKAYLDTENRMRGFSQEINIPMAQLDLVFWYKQAGYVFK